MLWYKMYSTDHNEILHTSRQCYCRDVCKIKLWSVEQMLNYSTPNFDRISNSIEIPWVGQAPGPNTAAGDIFGACLAIWQKYNCNGSLSWKYKNLS